MSLSNYKGSVEIASGFTPKNKGNFPLMQACDIVIDTDDTRLDKKLFVIEQKLSDPIDVDKTLQIDGAAADSKTVGDRLKAIEEMLSSGIIIGGDSNLVTKDDIDNMVGE